VATPSKAQKVAHYRKKFSTSNQTHHTSLATPFLPTKDFEASKRLYEALGFENVLDAELQKCFQQHWANNTLV
jgi:hypothetical protein